LGFTLLGVLAVAALLVSAQPASAQTCIQDVWKAHGNSQKLNCTAQDVTLSTATNINITAGGSCAGGVCRCFGGQNVTFTADFKMDLTADTRYDVGFYIATDGDPNHDGAVTGQCSATASRATNTVAPSVFTQLDAAPDVCGDITGPSGGDSNPLFVRATVTAPCPSGAGQQLQLPFCTTWRQPGSNQTCLGTGNGTTTNDVYPGSPSKCNCGTLAIDIFSETPSITVAKTALTTGVAETGGSASYSVSVTNNGTISVTLTSLTDDKYGNITTTHAANASCTGSATPNVCQAVTATNCTLATIAAGQTASCQFTGTVPPGDFPGSFTDTVTGCANNVTNPTPVCDDDDANVPYTDVPQAPTLTKTATGATCQVDVTYAVVVTNSSAQDTLTLNTLTDNVYGSITSAHAVNTSCTGSATPGVCGQVVSTTCGQPSPGAGALPAVIAVSDTYSCSFVGRITSCNATVHDTVSGSATDNDGRNYDSTTTPPFPTDDATVTVTVTGAP
jgi:hypothetical protein